MVGKNQPSSSVLHPWLSFAFMAVLIHFVHYLMHTSSEPPKQFGEFGHTVFLCNDVTHQQVKEVLVIIFIKTLFVFIKFLNLLN